MQRCLVIIFAGFLVACALPPPAPEDDSLRQTALAIVHAEQTAPARSPAPSPLPPDAPFPPAPSPPPPGAWLNPSPTAQPTYPATTPTPLVLTRGIVGRPVASGSVTLLVHRLQPLADAAPGAWLLDLSLRNDSPVMLRWLSPSRAGVAEADALVVRVGPSPDALRTVHVHGDLSPSQLARAANIAPPRCLGAWTAARWDYGQGPAPRWLAPGMSLRALLLLSPPRQHDLDQGVLVLAIPGATPIGIALPPSPAVEAPLGWRGRREPSVPFVLPGGGLVVDDVTVAPPQPNLPGARPCEWGRRLAWTVSNPTDAPLLPPAVIALDRAGWRLRLTPERPDEAAAVIPPGARRTIAWRVPALSDADGALRLVFIAPQRPDDPTTPWTMVDVP